MQVMMNLRSKFAIAHASKSRWQTDDYFTVPAIEAYMLVVAPVHPDPEMPAIEEIDRLKFQLHAVTSTAKIQTGDDLQPENLPNCWPRRLPSDQYSFNVRGPIGQHISASWRPGSDCLTVRPRNTEKFTCGFQRVGRRHRPDNPRSPGIPIARRSPSSPGDGCSHRPGADRDKPTEEETSGNTGLSLSRRRAAFVIVRG